MESGASPPPDALEAAAVAAAAVPDPEAKPEAKPEPQPQPEPEPQPQPEPVALGPRARALQKVFDSALLASLKACSYDNFAACFPTPARYVPDRLDALWRNMTARIKEFAEVCLCDCVFVCLCFCVWENIN